MKKRGHVLVVDDNPSNRKLVATLLAYEGYRVSEAADGAEGLSAARRNPPQLVISDILMPSMDGYEFVRRLRGDATMPDVPVIFYTANYHETEARSLADQCGVSRVIIKPCPAPDLLRAVADVISGGAARPHPAPDPGFDVEHMRLLTDKLSESANALRASNSRLAALSELNLQMASEHDPGQLLRSACVCARELAGARFAALAVADKLRQDGMRAFVSGLSTEPAGEIRDPRLDNGPLGRVFRERQALRLAGDAGTPLELGLPARFPLVSAVLAVPVCSLTREYGWLCLGGKVGAEGFSAEDERMLVTLGAQLGRIYENGSLYREVQEQATQLMVEAEERGLAVEQLRASEERFRELAENIQDVFFVSDPDLSRALYVSPAYERIWCRPAAEVVDRDLGWMLDMHPGDVEGVRAATDAIRRAFPARGELEFRILRRDGSTRWLHSRIFPIVEEGRVARTVGICQDITERKLAELRIRRLNRTHSVLSGINSLIVRARDRDTLLQDACRLAVDEGRFRVAWCGLLDEGRNELVARAFAGDADELATTVRVTLGEEQARSSMVIEALRSGRPGICNDLTRVDARVIYRERFVERGYRSMVALPLVVAGQCVGCFALLADATDYFDEEEMRLLTELSRDISFALDHIGKAERLDYLASFDPLTGLPNRQGFAARVDHHASQAAGSRSHFAVVVTDPERFEALNNTLGRRAGDEILRQAARRFAGAAGGSDACGHVGSDQFAAILPVTGGATDIGRQVDALLRAWLGTAFEVDGQSVVLSARAGVAVHPDDGGSADELLASASAALRDAKESGRPVAFYARTMSERFAERIDMERSLRHALENDEFLLHYQPKVDLVRRRVTGLEALLRWHPRGRDVVGPSAFVPLLEESGMIVEVGAWVMRQACLDRARWVARGLMPPRVAVNVSAVQLRRDSFVTTVSELVRQPGNEAALDIEVTESSLMEDIAENLARLEALRDLGIGIALDDFGTGYSSLAYLARLPVGQLKIDRSFIASMLEDPSAMSLVSTIISLARSLRLETVAEGVESEEQAKILRLLGCDQIQGFLVSVPRDFDAMAGFLAAPGG